MKRIWQIPSAVVFGISLGIAAWSQGTWQDNCSGCGGSNSNTLCCRCTGCNGDARCESCGTGDSTYYCKWVTNWGCCNFQVVERKYKTVFGSETACPCAEPGGGCSSTLYDDVDVAYWNQGLVCTTPYQTPCNDGAQWTSLLQPPYYCGQPCTTGGGDPGG